MQLEFYYIEWYYLPLLWPHRLTVRTPGSHPGNRGSIPREVTNLLPYSTQQTSSVF